MGTITAKFEGERVTVNHEYPEGPLGLTHSITLADGAETWAFNDELTNWRLEA